MDRKEDKMENNKVNDVKKDGGRPISEKDRLFDNYIISEKINKYKSFDELDLNDKLLRGIYGYGFEELSQIQKIAIKPVMDGRDIIAQSQSGTGKTGTFSIGTLNRIDSKLNSTQEKIISPTRELATQTYNVIKTISTYMDINIKLCIGGSISNRYNYYGKNDNHVVVGTPGRISDLINRKVIKCDTVKMVVIDEADDVLSTSFQDQIIKILNNVSKETQICLFSATIPDEIFILTDKILNNPLKILVKEEELSLEGIKQYYIYLGNQEKYKFDTLCDLYNRISIGQAMIYCNKKYIVDELSERLKAENFSVSAIHGEMRQKARQSVMNDFRIGKTRILVSTDILSRGIDVQQVSLVINYEVPKDTDTYLHRIGRSGRYGRKGVAINFVTDRDATKIRNIESAFGVKIEELPADVEKVINFI